MFPCERCQQLLLPYLYDLLDDGERQELRLHLDDCPSCQTALATARQQRDLFAAAVKEEFADVHFTEPSATTVAAVLPMPPALRRRSLLRSRWVAAAAVLLGVFGLSSAMTWESWRDRSGRVERAEQQMAQMRDALKDARDAAVAEQVRARADIQAIQGQLDQLVSNWKKDEELKRGTVDNQQSQLVFRGPRNYIVGAPNTYQLEMRDAKGTAKAQDLPDKLNVTAVDQRSNKTLYQQSLSTGKQQSVNIDLPRNLPVTPTTDLALQVEGAAVNGNATVLLRENLSLMLPEYVTHLTTDRPLYRPGDVVRFRSLTLERFSLQPAQEDLHLRYRLTGPNQLELFQHDAKGLAVGTDGKPVLGPDGNPVRGIGAGEVQLPADLPAGAYVLSVSEVNDRFPEERRSFLVQQRASAARYRKELTFDRSTYGAGDKVRAKIKIEPVTPPAPGGGGFGGMAVGVPAAGGGGGPVMPAPVPPMAFMPLPNYHFKAIVDGKTLATGDGNCAADGTAQLEFELPQPIGKDDGTLFIDLHDNTGQVESFSRSVPLAPTGVEVEFFPEGGDLVAGVPNRVYFQARTKTGRPVTALGRVAGVGAMQPSREVAQVRTLEDDQEPGINQGLGVFTFTPRAGERYQLRLDAPLGGRRQYDLPAVKTDGVVLHVPEGIVDRDIPVELYSAARDRVLLVGAYCRGRLLAHALVTAPKGQKATATLRPQASAGGVFRLTVFEQRGTAGQEEQYVPVAERLVYRRAQQKLDVAIRPDQAEYLPGSAVRLGLEARNEQRQFVPALALVAVTDAAMHRSGLERNGHGLPTHFLLMTEVRRPEDLESADVLLGPHPKAAQALDLLLGAQGWRRFAEQDPARFRKKGPPAQAPTFLAMAQPVRKLADAEEKIVAQLDLAYTPRYVELQKQLAEKEKLVDTPPEARQRVADLQARVGVAEQQYQQAVSERFALGVVAKHFLATTGLLAALGVAFLAVALGLRRSADGRRGRPLIFAGILLLAVLVLGSAIGTFIVMGPHRPGGEAGIQLHGGFKSVAAQGQATAPAGAVNLLPEAHEEENVPEPPPPPQADEPVAARKEADALNKQVVVASEAKKDTAEKQEQAEKRAMAPAFKTADPSPAQPAGRGMPQSVPGPGAAPGAPRMARGGGAGGPQVATAPAGPQGPAPAPAATLSNAAVAQNLQPLFRMEQLDELQQLRVASPTEVTRLMERPAAPEGERAADQLGAEWDRTLRQRGDFQVLLRRELGRRVTLPPASAPSLVREYAHRYQAPASPGQRDRTETLYWHPVLVLPGGKAEVRFDLADAATTYQVLVVSHTLDGRLGTSRAEIAARVPLRLEPKSSAPGEVTAGDVVTLPVTVGNAQQHAALLELSARTSGARLLDAPQRTLNLAPGEKKQERWHLQPSAAEGAKGSLRLQGKLQPGGTSSLERTFQVVPDGYPVIEARAGLLKAGENAEQEISLPERCEPGSLRLQLRVYPGLPAELLDALQGLQREPGAGFEPAAAVTHLSALLLDYLKTHNLTSPELEKRARRPLEEALPRVLACESTEPARRGYAPFPGSAVTDAVTARALLLLRDLARVYPIEDDRLRRARQYLLDRRGASPATGVPAAYVTWALASGPERLDRDLATLRERAGDSQDPYFLALVALAHLEQKLPKEALPLLQRLQTLQKEDGHLEGAKLGVTPASAHDLLVEASALAILAWQRANRPAEFTPNLQKATEWLCRQRDAQGGFGAPHATVLAVKALLASGQHHRLPVQEGQVSLQPQGQPPGLQTSVPARGQDLIVLQPPADSWLRPGANMTLEIGLGGTNNLMPYLLTWSYHAPQPAAVQSPLRLTTRLNKEKVAEGDTIRMTAVLENRATVAQGPTVAVVGLPAGLSVTDNRKQRADFAYGAGGVARPDTWEVHGRELVLYWREVAPGAKLQVDVDLTTRLSGRYRGPASRAYLYHDATSRTWAEPLSIIIDPR